MVPHELPDPAAACAALLHTARKGLSSLHGSAGDFLHSLQQTVKGHNHVADIDHIVAVPVLGSMRTSSDSTAEPATAQALSVSTADSRRQQKPQAAPELVTREQLGRSTWVLLHTLAAQYPERPSKQQRKDVATLVCLHVSCARCVCARQMMSLACMCTVCRLTR